MNSKLHWLFFLLIIAVSCSKNKESNGFNQWYTTKKTGEYDAKLLKQKVLESISFKIDSIYRSMKGPTDEQVFYLADSGDVIWLTGYKVEVINEFGEVLEPGFMCHNNLNLDSTRNFPWQSQNFLYQNRVFTLTQGATELNLPEGYAVPMPGEQGLKAMFQALNHNYPLIDTTVRHRITVSYFLDAEIDFPLIPVYMQTLWLVKQYAGPIGKMGEEPEYNAPLITSIDAEQYHPAQQPTCGVDMLANNTELKGVDMYYDTYGRKFTGHWKIPPGTEEIEMNVDKMLNIDKPRNLVMAVAHVHPFCKELMLIGDKGTSVKLTMQQANKGIGLNEIQVLVPENSIELKPAESYKLKSIYNNTSNDTLSAMSVMYVYLEE